MVKVQKLISGQLVITIPKVLAKLKGIDKGTDLDFKENEKGAVILEIIKKKPKKVRRKKR